MFAKLLSERIHNRNLYKRLVSQDPDFPNAAEWPGYASYSVAHANREGLVAETRKLMNMLDCSRRFFS